MGYFVCDAFFFYAEKCSPFPEKRRIARCCPPADAPEGIRILFRKKGTGKLPLQDGFSSGRTAPKTLTPEL